jgi:hypothetical protein
MKGSTAQVLLKSLKSKRQAELFSFLSLEPNGKKLVKLCKQLIEVEATSENELMSALKLTKGMFYHWMDVLSTVLVAFFGGKEDPTQLEATLHLATKLVSTLEYDAALDLIRAGLKSAEQIEDFNMVIRFWDATEPIIPAPKVEGMERATARKLLQNLLCYEDLLADLQEVAKMPNAIERRKAVAALQASDLLQTPATALSKRALYFYWKVKKLCHEHLREYLQAIPCEEMLLAHVVAHAWMFTDHEYHIARETSALAVLFRLSRQDERFREVSAGFEKMNFKSSRAEQERDFLRFPISIAWALQFGKVEELKLSIEAFLTLLATQGSTFAHSYITENLYACLYGALALKDKALWVKVMYQLSHFGKPDFKPKYWPMYRFLEVIHTIEDKDWEDATRLIKNLKGSVGLDELQGMREVLLFLSGAITRLSVGKQEGKWPIEQHLRDELLKATNGLDIVDYFDLPVWLEALERECPMIEIFHHRANAQSL